MTVPASIQSIQNGTVTKGNSIALSCIAAGTPPPMVSWVKVSSGQRIYSNLLEVTNASRNEAGEYRCEVSNECGNASETITIDVQCKLKGLAITLTESNLDKVCTCFSEYAKSAYLNITWTEKHQIYVSQKKKRIRPGDVGTTIVAQIPLILNTGLVEWIMRKL